MGGVPRLTGDGAFIFNWKTDVNLVFADPWSNGSLVSAWVSVVDGLKWGPPLDFLKTQSAGLAALHTNLRTAKQKPHQN